jgi:hypothetical protein
MKEMREHKKNNNDEVLDVIIFQGAQPAAR